MQYMCFDVQGGHWELVPFSSLGFVNCAVNGDWTGGDIRIGARRRESIGPGSSGRSSPERSGTVIHASLWESAAPTGRSRPHVAGVLTACRWTPRETGAFPC